MPRTERVYWVAARLEDGRAVVGMLAVLDAPPAEASARVVRGPVRASRVLEAEVVTERSAA